MARKRQKPDPMTNQEIPSGGFEKRLEEEVRKRTQALEATNRELMEHKIRLEKTLNAQQSISDSLIESTTSLKESKDTLIQAHSSLQANFQKMEEKIMTKEGLLKKLNMLYSTQLKSLQKSLGRLRKMMSAPEAQELLQQAVRETIQIEEVLRPIHTLYFTEQCIQNQRVLLAETSKKQQLVTKQALGGSGVELDIVDSLEEGKAKLGRYRYEIICADLELIELANIAHEQDTEIKTVFMTSDDAPVYLPLLRKYPFLSNIISRNEADQVFTVRNILTTVRKIISNDLFGLEKYLNWGVDVRQSLITRSDLRSQLIHEMETYWHLLGLRRSWIHKSAMVAEELLMNAIYDAPVNAMGESIYNHLPRTELVKLKKEEQGIFRYACDGYLMAVSVQDPFGAFSRKTILDYLERCYTSLKADTSQAGKGGAGRGLFQILETSDLLVINVKPGVKTEVIVLFQVHKSTKTDQTTSFHYFSG